MRHRKKGRQLSRSTSHRKALLRNLATELFRHGRIETTRAKAKEVQPVADHLITLGKRGDLHARRQAARVLMDQDVVGRLFGEIAPRYADRNGGYTRILRGLPRRGDNAEVAYLELVGEEFVAPPPPADQEAEQAAE